jgi:hypothetical protein
MKKLFILFGLLFYANLYPVTKQADIVFKKWLEWQKVYEQKNLEQLKDNLTDDFAIKFSNAYQKNLQTLTITQPFLTELTDNVIKKNSFEILTELSEPFKQNLQQLYSLCNENIHDFTQILKQLKFTHNTPPFHDANELIDADVSLMNLLFSPSQTPENNEILFTLANKFFWYCFSNQTFPTFQQMLLNKHEKAIACFLYANIWFHLAGTGWKHWSKECLKNLKTESEHGKIVTYIAGGSDIYQLIKNGIYNIRIIDPQLPSQPKYYTNDWQWLLKGDSANGGVGDQIIFNFDNKKIVMQRRLFKLLGKQFKARLANGQIISIPVSVTVWDIFDEQGNQLGSYTIERRFCEQHDFVSHEKRALLISFNELFFISLPDYLQGWTIKPNQFAPDLRLFVKQLAQPVQKDTINNIRIASILNHSDLKFISLGTCIN